MIENMLFIARSEQGQSALEKQQIPIDDVLSHLLDYFEFVAEDKNIIIQITGAKGVQVWVNLELLQRALSNLMTNAIDYGLRDGNISVHIQQHISQIEINVLTHDV